MIRPDGPSPSNHVNQIDWRVWKPLLSMFYVFQCVRYCVSNILFLLISAHVLFGRKHPLFVLFRFSSASSLFPCSRCSLFTSRSVAGVVRVPWGAAPASRAQRDFILLVIVHMFDICSDATVYRLCVSRTPSDFVRIDVSRPPGIVASYGGDECTGLCMQIELHVCIR